MVRREIEEKAIEISGNLAGHIPSGFPRVQTKIGKALSIAIDNNHRVLVVFSGRNPSAIGSLTARLLLYYEKVARKKLKEEINLLYVFHDEYKDALLRKEIVRKTIKNRSKIIRQTTAVYEVSEKYLGTTFQALVLDLSNDLKPNDVGRLIGIVQGGGMIILQTPPWEEWDTFLTIFKQNLLAPGYSNTRHIFISWFKRKLREHNTGLFVYNVDKGRLLSGKPELTACITKRVIRIPEETMYPKGIYKLSLTQDQIDVIKTMEWFYEKPHKSRKKILVVTADRGRGKSCAVGLGLIGFAYTLRKHKHRVRVLVTAPSLDSIQSLFQLAIKGSELLGLNPKPKEKNGKIIEIQGDGFSLEYWEPLMIPKLSGDIVAVDEASGIHVPLLHKIWRRHRRIVFASTIHGYEGAGRGFSIRFLKTIKEDPSTVVKHVDMNEPIRYGKEDPVEKWLFDALILDAEVDMLDDIDQEDITLGRLLYEKIDPYWLFSLEGEETLRRLFSIYVLAHYRNEPDDLAILADAPHHIIRITKTVRGGKIVGAIQAAYEGDLDDEVINSLLRGDKIPGNIIPDRMLKHHRVKEYGFMKGLRIVRIATHPEVQDRGIGSFMLSKIYMESVDTGLDWLGSGFGVNEKLLRFWIKNGFYVLHISPDRNPVSGEYTILVLKPITKISSELVTYSTALYKSKLLNSLYDTYKDLEIDIAHQMLYMNPQIETNKHPPTLSPVNLDRLWVYSYGPMTYEAATDIVLELTKHYFYTTPNPQPVLDELKEKILIGKVLQGRKWEDVSSELKVFRHKVTLELKDAVRKLGEDWYKLNINYEVGVKADDLGLKF
ncbi:MAG: tRNA(Met) cytidine acetyltransferase TmcA [Desulfurococcales archaeon]|nr:tRNA(Met) cytidine acetyltransferase TmcA [Desulfurococcales archaeon]